MIHTATRVVMHHGLMEQSMRQMVTPAPYHRRHTTRMCHVPGVMLVDQLLWCFRLDKIALQDGLVNIMVRYCEFTVMLVCRLWILNDNLTSAHNSLNWSFRRTCSQICNISFQPVFSYIVCFMFLVI